MPVPDLPTTQVVQAYLAKWSGLENYAMQERALSLLFHSFCPGNSIDEHVLLKVSALNDFYSTNIFDKYTVARHIISLNIDQRLSNADKTLVNALALVKIKGNTRNFYSFATKYCSHHNSAEYPIYDSYVEKMLVYFSRADGFAKFRKPDLKQYPVFLEIILKFRSYYNLQEFNLREIDIYLWLSGKDAFPPKYAGA